MTVPEIIHYTSICKRSSDQMKYRIGVTNYGAVRITNMHDRTIEVTIYMMDWPEVRDHIDAQFALMDRMNDAVKVILADDEGNVCS